MNQEIFNRFLLNDRITRVQEDSELAKRSGIVNLYYIYGLYPNQSTNPAL